MGLARLAALTERVKIGTSILLLPLYPPALVAKQIADLDRATNGRVILGVGIGGEYPQEFRGCQVPIKERGRRTDEMIPLIRRLWTARRSRTRAASTRWKTCASTPRRCRPAVPRSSWPVAKSRRCAAPRPWVTGGSRISSPRRYAASVETVTQAAAEAGHDLSAFEWYLFVFVNVNPDGDAAREEAARSMGGTYNQDFGPMVDSVAAAGTVEEVTAKLRAFHNAGARHFVFSPATAGADPQPVIDRLLGASPPRTRARGPR